MRPFRLGLDFASIGGELRAVNKASESRATIGRSTVLREMANRKRQEWIAAHGPGRCVSEIAYTDGDASFNVDALERPAASSKRRQPRQGARCASISTRGAAQERPAPAALAPGPLACLADRSEVCERFLRLTTGPDKRRTALVVGWGAVGIVVAADAGTLTDARPAFLALIEAAARLTGEVAARVASAAPACHAP